MRASARARGGDRVTAVAIGRALLGRPLPAQLTQVRCEKGGNFHICGLVLSGVKFKTRLGRRGFVAEVEMIVRGAFATAPLDEVDVWTTVPLAAPNGAVVSGDFAAPTSKTVFAITVPRTSVGQLNEQLASGRELFWDAAFVAALAKEDVQ